MVVYFLKSMVIKNRFHRGELKKVQSTDTIEKGKEYFLSPFPFFISVENVHSCVLSQDKSLKTLGPKVF